MLATGSLDGLFTGQLAFAIGVQWADGVIFAPGLGALPWEHIVGGVMHQQCAAIGGSTGQHADGFGVYLESLLAVAFRLVHGGVGGGVDDYIGGAGAHGFGQARQVGQVAAVCLAAGIQRQHLAQRGQAALQFPAYLAVLAQ
ncbi:hypothetical protein D3C81_1832230 [compost metagenome]